MAEGDSLVRIARKLEPAMLGREIVSASAPNPRSTLRQHARRLEGRRVERIETRGKHLLVHLDGGLSLHSHLGMNGGWRVDEGRGFGKPDRSAWLLLGMGDEGQSSEAKGGERQSSEVKGREVKGSEAKGSEAKGREPSEGDLERALDGEGARVRVAQFGGTTLRLVRTVELARDSRLAALGPDILAPNFDIELAASRLRASPDQVGVALLDQKIVCGIGNIFKSEACFEARVDPWRPAASLARADEGTSGSGGLDRAAAPDEAIDLLETARRQMLAAVETGKRPGRIYKKTGRPCPRCRAARIRSRGRGDDNRTTYWCPNCQS